MDLPRAAGSVYPTLRLVWLVLLLESLNEKNYFKIVIGGLCLSSLTTV